MSDRLKKAGMFSTDSNFCFSTQVQEVVKRSVIFCVRAKLQGGLCGKARRNNIAYLGKRGQFVPQIDFPRTKKGMFFL
jgi:hypothetical protein